MALRKAALSGSSAELPQVGSGKKKLAKEEPSEEGGETAYAARLGPDALTREYVDFSDMVNTRMPTVLRDLFVLKPNGAVIPVEETQDSLDLVRNHFRGAAMSHGALDQEFASRHRGGAQ